MIRSDNLNNQSLENNAENIRFRFVFQTQLWHNDSIMACFKKEVQLRRLL